MDSSSNSSSDRFSSNSSNNSYNNNYNNNSNSSSSGSSSSSSNSNTHDNSIYDETIIMLDSAMHANSDRGDPSTSIYKYSSSLFILALLSAAGLLAMSMNTSDSKSSSWKSSILNSRTSLAKAGTIEYSDLSTEDREELFDDFKKKYKKEYKTEHKEEKGFENFNKFLKTVDERNSKEIKKGGTAVHGVTIFADLSDDDFASSYLGFKETDEGRLRRSLKQKSSNRKPTKRPTNSPTKKSSYKNWADDGYTSAVRDQGYCGSCWAISAVEQIESDAIISGFISNKDSLSVQQVVSCDRNDYGCNGGNTETAYTYIGSIGGLPLEQTYPYTSYYDGSGHCKTSDAKLKVALRGYHTLDNEDDMQEYVLKNGPLSVCLAASSWSSYQSGVVSSCDKAVDHCVQLVGVDTGNGYWIVRNSWGTEWGDNGYIYLKTEENTCYITYNPTYTSVKAV